MSKPTPLSQVEHIVWHPVESVMPDDETAVLVRSTSPWNPVWIGFLICGDWFFDNAMRADEAEPDCKVTHWAELPEGPKQ